MIIVEECCLLGMFNWKIKVLVMGLKGLAAKTN
jgi:hypothetical protein